MTFIPTISFPGVSKSIMKTVRKTIGLLICFVAALVFSCADDHTRNTTTQNESYPADVNVRKDMMRMAFNTIAGTEWVLTGYLNTQLPAELRNRTTIKFSDDSDDGVFEVSGKAFINGYFGKFKVDEASGLLTPMGGVGSTKMGGTQQDITAELFYLGNLSKVKFFRLDDNNQLTLYFGDNEEIGYFSKK